MKFTTDGARKRFAELTAKRDEILAASEPLRAKRDKIVNDAREKETALNAEIKEIEAQLYDIDNERGLLARALGGRTGEPAE